jgi:hypothetical protein
MAKPMMRSSRNRPASYSTKREVVREDRRRSLRLGGLELEPDLSGAVFISDYSALLVADLHFEKGSSFAARGQPVPPFDTRSTLAVLEQAIARYRPQRLIALGDSFHDRGAGRRIAAADLERIRRLSQATDVIWIAGNHDAEIPQDFGGRSVAEIALGPLLLRHIPTAFLSGALEIAGHLHPVATISRRGRRLTARCFAANEQRLIMPAFGAYAGGLNVRESAISQLFGEGPFDAWLIGRAAIFPIGRHALS